MKLMNLTKTIFLIILLLSTDSVSGNPHTTYISNSYSRYNGLSADKITDMAKDELGTYWIATTNGLDRIIENHIYHYPQFSGDCGINFICSDNAGNIWVSSHFGLYLHDPETDLFTQLKVDGHAVTANDYALTQQSIWFCTDSGILEWYYTSEKAAVRTSREDTYETIDILSNGSLIVSNQKAIYSLDLNSGNKKTLLELEEENDVRCTLVDTFNRLWVSIYNKGIISLSTKGEGVTYKMSTLNSGLTNDIVLKIYENDDLMYLCTDGGGICVMDLASLKITSLEEQLGVTVPKQFSSTLSFLKDQETILCGTIRYGVQYLTLKPVNNLSSYSNGQQYAIQCLTEIPDGKVLIGTDGEGLKIFDPETDTLQNLDIFKGEKIVSVVEIAKKNYLVSIYSKGIYLYDSNNGYCKRITIADSKTDKEIFNIDQLVRIYKCPSDQIFIFADKLYVYNPETQLIQDAGFDNNDISNPVPFDDNSILVYSKQQIQRLWTETLEMKSVCDSCFEQEPVFASDGKKLWIARDGFVIARDLQTGKEQSINIRKNTIIQQMVCDQEGNLWIASHNCLIQIPYEEDENYRIFTESDGVLPNDYYYTHINLLTSDGRLYFGGSSGLNMLNIPHLLDSYPIENVSLLSIQADGEPIGFNRDDTNRYEIMLPYDFKSIKMEFCVNNTDIASTYTYKYVIRKGKKTQEIISDNNLELNRIKIGNYKISIYVLDCHDSWIKSSSDISLKVSPHNWIIILVCMTIYLLILLGLAIGIYLYYRKKKAQNIENYNAHKKKLTEKKITFLINVSHELRTPLTLIYAPLKRLIEKESIPDGIKDALKPIYHQSMQMIRIINLILDSRKFEEGYSKLIVTANNFNDWGKKVTEDFTIEYQAKRIELTFVADQNIGTVNFDEGKLTMALSNFLMNAYKYSNPDSKVEVKTSISRNCARISVIDNGIGIKDYDAERLFKMYERNSVSADGFGLGLSYTKQLVELHPGGKIGASANKEGGSTFWFEIPYDLKCTTMNIEDTNDKLVEKMLTTENVPSDEESNEAAIHKINLSDKTILVVEDDCELLDFLANCLEENFKKVIKCEDGTSAYEKAKEENPDIILSDVMMSGMNGYELCTKVKNNIDISHIPVILMTAQADPRHRTEAYKSCADLFISKPFDITTIITAIQNILANRRMIRERFKNNFVATSAVSCSFSNADENFLNQINEYIDANISNEFLDSKMIYTHMCMSRSNFYKKMKELTDIGIKEYVNNIRMKTAATLLISTKLNISEIANKVGIPDAQYFSKAFKSHFNMTPTNWRKKNN